MENRKLGIYWLQFFCYIRPWLVILLTIPGFIKECYSYGLETILTSIWGYVYCCFIIITAIAEIALYVRAIKKDKDLYSYIEKLLIYQLFPLSFFTSFFMLKYINDYFTSFILCILFYFSVWYILNKEYFSKRVKYFENYGQLSSDYQIGDKVSSIDRMDNDLRKLKGLLDDKIITKEEYELEKKKVLKDQ